MFVFRGYHELNQAFPDPVVTIGNFDGLHLGHRQIIQSVIDRAKRLQGTSVVYTFRPHPHLALTPENALQLINTYDEKLDLLRSMGVDVVIEEPFSREFSTIAPEKFFQDILLKRLSAVALYVGYDFGFGKNRAGNLEMLKGFCDAADVELTVATPLKVDGETCSSTKIRGHIQSGDVASAARLLGREFFYRGLIVRGNGRGHKIGFATANVKTEEKLRVKEGVYATLAQRTTPGKDSKSYLSVTNVGRQPTFNKDGAAPVAVETHIFDFDQDIYGETLEVRMVDRIREERRFDGVESLVSQIKQDCEIAKRILARTHPTP